MRSRAHFTQSDLEKKMAMQRDASKTEGKHLIVQIERKHREEQSKLRRDLVELKQEYTQQLADQAAKAVEREAVLLQKLTDLDGGLAAKEYQRQQFIEHLYTSAARRLQNIELSRGFLAWTSWYMDHLQLKFAMARLFHMQLFHSWNTWVEFCQVRATQKRVMVAAAVRMMKPKLIAAYTHWRRDWELRCVQDEMDARVKELQNAMRTQREKFEQEFERLKAELRKAEERELASTLGSGSTVAGDTGGFTPQVVEVTMAGGNVAYRMGGRSVASRESLADLVRALPKAPGIVVRVADDVPVEGAAAALQGCRDAGFERIAYQPGARSGAGQAGK